MDENLTEKVDYYVRRLRGPHADDAWHSLCECGQQAVPLLLAYYPTAETELRPKLISVIAETRSPCYSFYKDALHDGDRAIWNEAINGLCRLGTLEAIAVLECAHLELSSSKPQPPILSYLLEAIELIKSRTGP